MARLTNIKLRRSGTSGNVPTTSQLDLGELAINTYDGKLYLKKNVAGTESIVDVGSNQSAVYKEYVYTATSNQTTFSGSDDNSQTLTYITGYLQVFLNGVLLENGTDYTANTLTSVVLVNGASAGDILQISTFVKVLGTGDIVTDTFSGTGTTPNYTLSATPDNADNIIVFVDGVYQEKSTYSVSGTTLTFDANLPNGVTAEVVIGSNNVTLTNIDDLNLGGDLTVASGSVGIGTANPDKTFVVSGADAEVVINDSNNTPLLRFRESGTSAALIKTDSGKLVFTTRPSGGTLTDVGAFDTDGNFGIGTISPNAKLEVKASAPTLRVAANERTTAGQSNTTLTLESQARESTNNRYSRYNFIVDPNNNYGQASLQIHYLNDGVDYGERLRIDSGGNVGIGNTLPKAKLQVEEYGINTTETSTTATTQVAIHTFAAADFRSARYSVQVTNSTDSTYHISEILLVHDGTTPSITEYGTIFTGSAEATFDADISSGNVRLLATPASTDSMEFKVVCHSITV